MKSATISLIYIWSLFGSAFVMWATPFFAQAVEPPDVKEYGILGVIIAVAVREMYRHKDTKQIDAIKEARAQDAIVMAGLLKELVAIKEGLAYKRGIEDAAKHKTKPE